MRTWEDKVHETIARLSREAWLKANTTKSGKRRKKHVPYTLPQVVHDLVHALRENDEEACKAIMLYRYECQK